MRIAVFEDEKTDNFLPLTYMRAFFDLRIGKYTFLQRAERVFGRVDVAFTRDYLRKYYAVERKLDTDVDDVDDDILLINPRFLLDEKTVDRVLGLKEEKEKFALFSGDSLVAALVPKHFAEHIIDKLGDISTRSLYRELKNVGEILNLEGAKAVVFPWQLIEENSKALVRDLDSSRLVKGEVDETVRVLGDNALYVGDRSVVEPYVTIDTRNGPVYIGEGAVVHSFTYIQGPAYIGDKTVVMPRSVIREGSNIGDVCRVGGEVEESIVHGFSNKYHDGFLGHAYVGEWVNLGALTTNSDLKNTYGNVKVTVNGRRVDTGSRKVGAFIGDMAKTSIGTLIYTGKKIGVASHVHGLVSEDVPSFTIYARSLGAEPVELRLESAIETQRRIMERRGRKITDALVGLIIAVYNMTAKERMVFGVKAGSFRI